MIGCFLATCKNCSLDISSDLEKSVKGIIIVCTKFVDRQDLFKHSLGDFYTDWDYIGQNIQTDGGKQYLGDISVWSSLLEFVNFGEVEIPDSVMFKTHAPLWCIYNAVKISGALEHELGRKTFHFPNDAAAHRLASGGAQATEPSPEPSPQLPLMMSTSRSSPPLKVVSSHSNSDSSTVKNAAAEGRGVTAVRNGSGKNNGNIDKLNFSDICKLFILNNLSGMKSKHVVDQYTSFKLVTNAFEVCSNIMSALADQRHDATVYSNTLKYVMSIARVNHVDLMNHIVHHNRVNDTNRQTWAVKYIQNGSHRPSMRKISASVNAAITSSDYINSHASSGFYSYAASSGRGGGATGMNGRASSVAQGGSACTVANYYSTSSPVAATVDNVMMPVSFAQYCDSVRFPNSMSRLLMGKCYLLAAQGHCFDYTKYTTDLVTIDIATSLNRNPVIFPDVNCMCNVIDSLVINTAPFRELNDFRLKCFLSFSHNQRKGITMTLAFQLYVCAYQRKDIWKTCWKNVYAVMSGHISRDVEAFVACNAFAAQSFFHILKTSIPFVDLPLR